LESLRFYPVRFPEGSTRRQITRALNRLMMLAIEGEEESLEGVDRGYERDPEVRADIRNWEDALLAPADVRQVERSDRGLARAGSAGSAIQGALERRERLADLRRHLQDLARRFGVEFFADKLARIVTIPFSMVTRRYIGFGATMTAVPALAPEREWISGPEDRYPP
jgi:hypothetical protein